MSAVAGAALMIALLLWFVYKLPWLAHNPPWAVYHTPWALHPAEDPKQDIGVKADREGEGSSSRSSRSRSGQQE